jgi:hypothetical protein
MKKYVILLATTLVLITGLLGCTTQPVKAGIPETELWKQQDSQRIINAYSNLLHRIWIDKPSYVEDVLWDTDEMLELDELLGGEWDKTFEFWSAQDSIEYHLNWIHVDELTHM